MSKALFKVGGCQWVIYNMLKKTPLTSVQIQHRIADDFTKWSRAFIQRKLKDGVELGIYVITGHEKSKLAGYAAAVYGINPKAPKIEPCLESVDPEVFYYLMDLKRLEASVLTFKAMFKLTDNDRLNNTLKHRAAKEKHMYHLKLIVELKATLEQKAKRGKKNELTTG